MNVLLLSTDLDVWALGLRSISAVLKAAGHNTSLVFMTTNERRFNKTALEELALLARHFEVVGVSCLARGSEKAKQIIEFLHLQKKLIVWGGVHASLNPEECADWADIVCRGEGEEMMLDLLNRLDQGQDWKAVESIVYKENGLLKANTIRPPISNLDQLPLPDYTFEHEYHLSKKGLVQVSTLEKERIGNNIIFNSSRGCAFHCTYCCNIKIKSLYAHKERYVRRMSVSKLIEHSQNLRRIFPQAKRFYFIDEDFGARPINELEQFSDEFPQKIGLPFECLTHPAQVSYQKMDLLVKAGLYRLNIGIESGSERTRKEIYDRHVSNKVITRAADIISHYKQLAPYYLFIIGNPYEERSDLIATARFISELPYGCNLTIYNLVFFPGSFLWERAVQERLIEDKKESGYELDFLGGFKYTDHAWKKKNLYLNGVISLMEGPCTKSRIGVLPRFIIRILLDPRRIELFEHYLFIMKIILSIRSFYVSVEHRIGNIVREIFSSSSHFTRSNSVATGSNAEFTTPSSL